MVRYPAANFVSTTCGRTGVGPSRTQALHRPRVADHRAEHRGHRRVPAVAEREGIEPMMAVNLAPRGGRRGRGPGRVLQRRSRIALGGPADRERTREAVTRQALVPGQRDGRPVADRAQGRRRVRQARGGGRKAMRLVEPVDRAGRLRVVGDDDGHLRCWSRQSSATPGTSSTTSRCTRTTRSWTRPRLVPRVRTSIGPVHPPGRRVRRRGRRAAPVRQGRHHLVRRVERLVPEVPLRRRAEPPAAARRPRIIEDVYSALDAVVVGDLLVTLLNHADPCPSRAWRSWST